jgi:hypothetical protein
MMEFGVERRMKPDSIVAFQQVVAKNIIVCGVEKFNANIAL